MGATFTVVCVYNSEATLNAYFLRGMSRQSTKPEVRLIDNRRGRFSSAAAALNHGAAGVNSDYIVFAHQDVELLEPDFFEQASKYLMSLPNLGLAGVVGAVGVSGATELRGACLQGDRDAAGFSPGFSAPLAVQTVDEQVLIVATQYFRQVQFDTLACPAWDLYGVEYALECARRGRDVRVLPLGVRHASWGKLRRSYFETLARVQAKHPRVDVVHTTCGTWSERRPPWLQMAVHKLGAARNRLWYNSKLRRVPGEHS